MDTIRAMTDLLTLWADNTIGAISPQDGRDFILSMKNPHGSLMLTTPAATTIAVPGTFYKAAGTTQLSTQTDHYLVDQPVNNRLRYTGTTVRHFHIVATLGMTTTGTNDVLGLAIAKNGVVLDHSKTRRFVGSGADIGSTAIHADTSLNTDDYLEVFVTNENAAVTVTLQTLYMFAMGMFM